MVFVACGLNHKTAPITVRETIALPVAMQNELLHDLVSLPTVNEAAILSTCNRTEIYCDTDDPGSLIPWLTRSTPMETEQLSPYFYLHHGHHGVRHTLRVASGLDSMMLGEPQILGQMKQAYQQACQAGTVKTRLRPVFEYVFSASKRVRSRSGIGTNPVSIAYAAVQRVGQLFSEYAPLRVLLIGAGETTTLVAKYLHKQGVRRFRIASRTLESANNLAQTFAGEAINIGDIPQYLPEADVVITATACPLPFINKSLVEHALHKRKNAPMFFLDLAVPRDIEADVGSLDQVHLYNIDDMQSLIDQGMNERRFAAQQAEELIDCELDNYIRWHRSLRANSTICHYRDHMQHLAQQELQRAKTRLDSGLPQNDVLDEFCTRLVNKLLHNPTIGMKQAARDGKEELLDLSLYLYNLTNDPITV